MAYRILRICSEEEDLNKRLGELKNLLLEREYRKRSIEDAISRVLKISRREAIKKVPKRKNERPVFALTFNPALPSVSHILQKHWRVMQTDPYLKKVFPQPPMVAFRRTTNLREKNLSKPKFPLPHPKERNVKLQAWKNATTQNVKHDPTFYQGRRSIPLSMQPQLK